MRAALGHLLDLFIDHTHTSIMQFSLRFHSGKNELFSNYFVLCESMSHIALDIHFDVFIMFGVCATGQATLNPHNKHFTQLAQYLSISQAQKMKTASELRRIRDTLPFSGIVTFDSSRPMSRQIDCARTPVNWN